ncbi:winged helix-turn-helix transcriptional regulator [Nesterenkonia sp. MY13]|uniref:Winged helix-turn-helix transcriptional regulator n=1 Tax=Nesterenkonia sedimenti TaxID=1463632 RepID=A0A7X8TJ24_9MICC|nr:winged helix-turn-helix domain-containing protein [Nesterenkonia sedimenti]NLS09672.1 winged helix-turn-helix transcriptional regulator [Nesterenkonia sedimenti]
MSAPLSQAQNPGYVHVSVRNAARRAEIARKMRNGNSSAKSSKGAAPAGEPRTAPVPVIAPNGGGSQVIHPDIVARGFVVYVGLDEDTATAAGTSLHRIATELRDYVEHIAPESQVHIAMAMASAAAEGSDLEVVRQALGDPTVTNRLSTEPVAQQPAPAAPSSNGVLIDLARREVQLDGEGLNLTYKEFELLNYLVDNSSRTVGREELLKTLWRNMDQGQMPNERTIDVHVRRLRSKLGRLANTVRTVRGQGYRFYEHPEVTVWAAPEYSI